MVIDHQKRSRCPSLASPGVAVSAQGPETRGSLKWCLSIDVRCSHARPTFLARGPRLLGIGSPQPSRPNVDGNRGTRAPHPPPSWALAQTDRQTRAVCHRTRRRGPRPFRFRHFQCLSSVLARPQGFKVSPRGARGRFRYSVVQHVTCRCVQKGFPRDSLSLCGVELFLRCL